jgi:hypothetical protein
LSIGWDEFCFGCLAARHGLPLDGVFLLKKGVSGENYPSLEMIYHSLGAHYPSQEMLYPTLETHYPT